MHAWDLLKEVPIIFITSIIVWPQVTNREETQPHPSTENWIKDLLSMAPPIRIRLKELQAVHPKGDQSWVFIRRTDAEAETPILWPPDMKS